jgi:hypothetical protein
VPEKSNSLIPRLCSDRSYRNSEYPSGTRGRPCWNSEYVVLPHFPNRPPNTRHGFQNFASDQFRINPQYPIPHPLKHAVPPRVCGAPERMSGAINFHDQLRGGSYEINDVPINRNLAFEGHAKLPAGKLGCLSMRTSGAQQISRASRHSAKDS